MTLEVMPSGARSFLGSGPISALAATGASVILNGMEMHSPRADDRRVVSGIVFVIKGGLRWRDAPSGYGPHGTLYSHLVRLSRMGVFDRIFAALIGEAGEPDRLIIDSTHL